MPANNLNALANTPDYAANKKRRETIRDTVLKFPPDLGNHFIEFDFVEVKPSEKGEQQNNSRYNGSTIILPIPNNLHDETSITYQDVELGTLFGGILTDDAIKSGLNVANDKLKNINIEGFKSIGTKAMEGFSVDEFHKNVIEKAPDRRKQSLELVGLAGHKLAETAGGALGARVQSIVGSRFNPFLSVFFQNVNLKTHQFNWKLSPKSEKESEILRDIINLFKVRSLPEIEGQKGIRLKNPHQVQISLVGSDDYLYPFKQSYIEQVGVNYTAEGRAAFFAKTGAPAIIDLTIGVREIYVHTSEDYQEKGAAPGTGIGE